MANKKINIEFIAKLDTDIIKGQASELQKTFNSLNLSKGLQNSTSNIFKKLQEELNNYGRLTSKASPSAADVKGADKSLQKILKTFEEINDVLDSIDKNPVNFIEESQLKKIQQLQKSLEKAKESISNTGIAAKKADITKQYDKTSKKIEETKKEIEQLNATISSKKTERSGIETQLEEAKKTAGELKKELNSLTSNPVNIEKKTQTKDGVKTTIVLNSKEVENYKNKLAEVKQQLNETERAIENFEKDLKNTSTQSQEKQLESLNQELEQSEQALKGFEEGLKHVKKEAREEALEKLRNEIADITGLSKKDIPNSIPKIEEFVASLEEAEKTKVGEVIRQANNNLKEMGNAGQIASEGMKETVQQVEALTRAERDMQNLKNQILDFFSISNTIQIFKRSIREAFETVKELDAVMTETAVVTNFNIGDMWDRLPEYSSEATKLGASIRDLYSATTLYYQQGLQTEAAMGVGIETMKMARIAGMEAVEATEAMTAALRGFNMEVNETNAVKVNDVYSELAAITAADTEQIATAMSKTASIAASANMEFETTAALLAQIIETTQEAPETAGTALKTIIARFSEVKKLREEGVNTGEDEEGEAIDVNKIQGALRTVGISMDDFFAGAEGLDSILLKLAEKWKDLDFETQRYIATTAAGSRQQSRFIAMMSDYERTMELATAANNSAGASQQQFDKTLESLDAKLQKLKNAWDTFVMGLANNEVIKTGVDLLTKLLETVNNLTGAAGNEGIGGLVTMVLRLGTIIGAIKGGEAIFNSLLKLFASKGIGKGLFGKIVEAGELKGLGEAFATLKQKAGGLSYLGQMLKNVEDRKEIFSILGESIKTLGGNLGAFFAKFGGWIALAAALAVAITAIVKSFQGAQKSARMENLQNSLTELQEEASEARNELSAIGSAKDNLENLENTLDGLTKGTDEWKQALIAVNEEVLGLIQRYPDLADNLITGKNGQLGIEESGWEEIYQKQQGLITNLMATQNYVTLATKELQEAMNFDEFVIGIQETDGDKFVTETEIKIADWYDSETKSGVNVGQMVAATNDAYLQGNDPSAIVGQWLGKTIAGWFGANVPSDTPFQDYHNEAMGQGGYAKTLQREQTGGLTQEEYTDLAAAFTEAGITFSDGLTDFEKEQAQQIYNNFGYDLAIFDQVIAAAEEVGASFDELGAETMGLVIQQEAAIDSFVSNAVSSNKKIGNLEYGNAVANLIASTEKYEDLTKRIDEEKAKIKEDTNANQRMSLYAEKFGKYYADGKLYTDSSMEHQLELSDDYITEALASANITLEISEQAEKLVSEGLLGKNIKLFDKLFSKEGTELQAGDVIDYTSNGAIDFEKIAEDMGYIAAEGKTAFANMAAAFDMDPTELEQIINQNFKSATDRIAKQRKDLTKKMSKYSKKGQQGYELNAGILSGLELKFGEEIRGTLEDVFNSLDEAGDENLLAAGFEQFKNVAMKGTIKEVQELKGFIDSIDWSNPIDAAHKLNQEVKNGTAITRNYAQEMLKAGDSFLSADSQMQYFLKSEEFKEVKENLSEIIENNQEITASDILSLADDYKTLDKIMENTGATAGGLAEALQQIQEGKIGLYQLTDAVMASLTGFDSLDSVVADTLKTLSEFDPGADEDEVFDFINSAYETLHENLEKGAVGNSQNFAYLDFLFPGWDKGLEGDALVKKMKKMTNKLKELNKNENMRPAWSDLAEGKDVYGNKIDFDKDSGRTKNDVKVTDTGKEIKLTGYEGMTTNEMVAWIADAYNVSENYAKMMLTDFKNYSSDLAQELNKNDYTAGLEAAYEKLNTVDYGDIKNREIKQQKIIDESEIEAIASLYNMKIEDVREDFKNKGAFITDFYDENGLLKETNEIIAQLDTIAQSGGATGAKWINQFTSTSKDGTKIINIDKLNAELARLNIPEEARAGMTQDIINSIQQGTEQPIEIKTKLSDGKEYNIPITPDIDVETAINNAEKDLENSALADAIAQAFTNVEINPTVKTEDITGGVVAAVKAADGTPVVVIADEASLTQLGIDINTAATQNPPTIVMNANATAIENKIKELDKKSITITVNYSGKYPHFASGVKKSPFNYGDSLVSEEGPELIQKANGTAYLSGTEGPEIAQINRGDTVYTAEETEQILKRKNKTTIPRYADGYGYGDAYGPKKKDKNSKSSKGEEGWENPYDKQYNTVQKINVELRKREKLEKRYQNLIAKSGTTPEELRKNQEKQIASVKAEMKNRQKLLDKRKDEMENLEKKNKKYKKYAYYDEKEGRVVINWKEINKIKDPEKGKKVEDYIKKLEEKDDQIKEQEDALDEQTEILRQIYEQGRDEYLDLEDRVKDALIGERQKEIDKLSAINDSINDTNTRLISAMQASIDKYRQDRENARTEEELSDKQRRLAYLRQDTSGANALEIMQLEKELEQGQEDYTDTLVDQKISELQQQNDEAAEQRERQIQIAQEQLDKWSESGEIWKEVNRLMTEGIDINKGLIKGSELETILRNQANFSGLSGIGQMQWLKELENQVAMAVAWLTNGATVKGMVESGMLKKDTEIEFTTADGKSVKGRVQKDGTVKTDTGEVYKNVRLGYDGKWVTEESYIEPKENKKTQTTEEKKDTPKKEIKVGGKINAKGAKIYGYIGGEGYIQHFKDDPIYKVLDEKSGYLKVRWHKQTSGVTGWFKKSDVKAYKQGGLADFTGPAWLDGTKSKPEYILNAEQTKSFFELVDVLGSLKGGINQNSQITGDSIYDVDINVESIGSDYDVEQLASTVKRMIVDDARYRNNNVINLSR